MADKKIIRTKTWFRVARINRRRACRLMCKECVGWESENQIWECTGKFLDGETCHLHPFRDMEGEQNTKDRAKAIRSACLYCMGEQISLVVKCVSTFCPLHPYRIFKKDSTHLYNTKLSDEEVLQIGLPKHL